MNLKHAFICFSLISWIWQKQSNIENSWYGDANNDDWRKVLFIDNFELNY